MKKIVYFILVYLLMYVPYVKSLPPGWYIGLKGGMSQFSGDITSEYWEENDVFDETVPFIPTNDTTSKIKKSRFFFGIEGGYIFPINDDYFWGASLSFDPTKFKINHTRRFTGVFSNGIATVDVDSVVQDKITRNQQYMGSVILGRRWENGMSVYGKLGVAYAQYKYSFVRTEIHGSAHDIFNAQETKGLWGVVPAFGVGYVISDQLTLALEVSYTMMQPFNGKDLDTEQDVMYRPKIKSSNLQGAIVVRYHF